VQNPLPLRLTAIIMNNIVEKSKENYGRLFKVFALKG
jgi:hypothetical protein